MQPLRADPELSAAPPRSRLQRVIQKAWWLHSLGALSFGVGVMVFARKGLQYADKLLMVLPVSWLLVFVALRTIVGPANRAPEERLSRKGVRILTNYVIKNLYQQMFFFLVPLYASSATWSLSAYNWWLPPVLLACAVVSTMDLVFDNVIMERRILASAMYGLAMFAVLNLMLPVVFQMKHFPALIIAAAATAPAVALLGFRLRAVVRPLGLATVLACAGGLVAAAWFGRAAIPPVPLAMAGGAVGHGTLGSYECLPGVKQIIYDDQLDGLRCGSHITQPGGLHDEVVHVWRHDGREVARMTPERLDQCEEGLVLRSVLPAERLPAEATGAWSCRVETEDGQLIGLMRFRVKDADARDGQGLPPPPAMEATSPDAGASDAQGGEHAAE